MVFTDNHAHILAQFIDVLDLLGSGQHWAIPSLWSMTRSAAGIDDVKYRPTPAEIERAFEKFDKPSRWRKRSYAATPKSVRAEIAKRSQRGWLSDFWVRRVMAAVIFLILSGFLLAITLAMREERPTARRSADGNQKTAMADAATSPRIKVTSCYFDFGGIRWEAGERILEKSRILRARFHAHCATNQDVGRRRNAKNILPAMATSYFGDIMNRPKSTRLIPRREERGLACAKRLMGATEDGGPTMPVYLMLRMAFDAGYEVGVEDAGGGELLAEAMSLQNAFFDLDAKQKRAIAFHFSDMLGPLQHSWPSPAVRPR